MIKRFLAAIAFVTLTCAVGAWVIAGAWYLVECTRLGWWGMAVWFYSLVIPACAAHAWFEARNDEAARPRRGAP